jgi:CheY-like chemotaxis protein
MSTPVVPPSGTHRVAPRILVIDDEPSIGRALKRCLSRHCDVVVAIDGAAALEALQRGERYDLVLCDLMMPVMDGIEFYRQLKATLPDEVSRVVFLSGGASGARTARVEAFFRSVPNPLLEKPIDMHGLRALIERSSQVPRAACG